MADSMIGEAREIGEDIETITRLQTTLPGAALSAEPYVLLESPVWMWKCAGLWWSLRDRVCV